MPRLKATLLLLSLATACVPATLAQSTYGAVPGTLNFVQGQANIDGQPIQTNTDSSGNALHLHAGETLATAHGTADILLAPGALLRIGNDSTVQVIAEDATRAEVRLEQGIANVSVNVVGHDHLLLVDLQNGQTQMLSRGLYTFNTATNTVRVFNGEADIFRDSDTNSDVKPVKLKEGHELILGGDRAKPASFDRELADNDLLPWTGPKESQAVLATVHRDGGASYGYAGYGYGPGAYGFSPAFGYGDPYLGAGLGYGVGYGYPYAWGPYGFYGYPFFGVGFGYWGGGFYRGPVFRGPVRGGYAGGFGGGYAGHAFAGGHSVGGGGGRR